MSSYGNGAASLAFFFSHNSRGKTDNIVIMGQVVGCFPAYFMFFYPEKGNMAIRDWTSAKKPDDWWIHENLNISPGWNLFIVVFLKPFHMK